MKLHHLLGPVKAKGIYDPKIQHIIQRHCDAGNIAEIAEVVARFFFDDGTCRGYIPTPSGVKTKELVERVCASAKKIAEDYAKRGVLCAKGYYPPQMLMLSIIRMWEEEFNSIAPPDESGLPGVYDAEGTTKAYLDRSTVASVVMAASLQKRLKKAVVGGVEVLVLPMSELEGFCSGSVRVMYQAFTKPDEHIHELLHGEKPTEE